jgi:hypothetical protein
MVGIGSGAKRKVGINKKVKIGSEAERDIDDYVLSRCLFDCCFF